MSTVLPFGRAVKALAESLGVCALMLTPSCASRGVERATDGPLTGPARVVRSAPTASVIAASASTSTADTAAGDAALSAAIPNDDAPRSLPELSIEQPYPLDARPRAANPLQAAADDEELARWNVGGTADPNYPSSQTSFHPGTRVVVDTHFLGRRPTNPNGSSHGSSADRVQAQARSKGYWPFRLCFEAGQREKKGLGGETRIVFTIGPRGAVSAAHLVSSALGNPSSSACLLDELRKLRFPPRSRRIDVAASIRIWPGDAELPALSDGPPETIDTTAGFDPAAVSARVVRRLAEFTTCFREAQRSDSNLWGRLALAVVLEVDGSVHRVSEVESHFPNANAARCAAATLSSIPFPSVNGKPFSFVLAMRLPPPKAVAQTDSNPNATRPDQDQAPSPPDNDAGNADD